MIMKNTYSIAERNSIVEEHLYIIDRVMHQNHKLIRAARLDRNDVYQQLAERLIRAVDNYDPSKGKLKSHLYAQVTYELLNYKRPNRLYGIPGMPGDYRSGDVISFELIGDDICDADALIAA